MKDMTYTDFYFHPDENDEQPTLCGQGLMHLSWTMDTDEDEQLFNLVDHLSSSISREELVDMFAGACVMSMENLRIGTDKCTIDLNIKTREIEFLHENGNIYKITARTSPLIEGNEVSQMVSTALHLIDAESEETFTKKCAKMRVIGMIHAHHIVIV